VPKAGTIRWDIDERDGDCLVTIAGELDISSCDSLRDALSKIVPDAQSLILDVAGLKFLDSTGLRCLLDIQQQLQSIGKSLVLRRPSLVLHRVLEVAGVDGLFVIEH
jgi:anti-sigma B factor antagonist